MVNIPDEVFTKYKEFGDAMINQLGINCKVVYPPKRENCVNCVYDPIGKKSANRYRHGGPKPFNFGRCPMCGGNGFKEVESEEVVKLRVYYDYRDFVKVDGVSINAPGERVQIIGYLTDMHKVRRANEIIINSDKGGYGTWRFVKGSEPAPWGLKKDRYFVAFLERA